MREPSLEKDGGGGVGVGCVTVDTVDMLGWSRCPNQSKRDLVLFK